MSIPIHILYKFDGLDNESNEKGDEIKKTEIQK